MRATFRERVVSRHPWCDAWSLGAASWRRQRGEAAAAQTRARERGGSPDAQGCDDNAMTRVADQERCTPDLIDGQVLALLEPGSLACESPAEGGESSQSELEKPRCPFSYMSDVSRCPLAAAEGQPISRASARSTRLLRQIPASRNGAPSRRLLTGGTLEAGGPPLPASSTFSPAPSPPGAAASSAPRRSGPRVSQAWGPTEFFFSAHDTGGVK